MYFNGPGRDYSNDFHGVFLWSGNLSPVAAAPPPREEANTILRHGAQKSRLCNVRKLEERSEFTNPNTSQTFLAPYRWVSVSPLNIPRVFGASFFSRSTKLAKARSGMSTHGNGSDVWWQKNRVYGLWTLARVRVQIVFGIREAWGSLHSDDEVTTTSSSTRSCAFIYLDHCRWTAPRVRSTMYQIQRFSLHKMKWRGTNTNMKKKEE